MLRLLDDADELPAGQADVMARLFVVELFVVVAQQVEERPVPVGAHLDQCVLPIIDKVLLLYKPVVHLLQLLLDLLLSRLSPRLLDQ